MTSPATTSAPNAATIVFTAFLRKGFPVHRKRRHPGRGSVGADPCGSGGDPLAGIAAAPRWCGRRMARSEPEDQRGPFPFERVMLKGFGHRQHIDPNRRLVGHLGERAKLLGARP